MYNLNNNYQNLLKDILDNGEVNNNDLVLIGKQISCNTIDKIPIFNNKTSILNDIITELKWVLRGGSNIKYLIDNNCHTWNNIAYEYYLNNYKNLKSDFKELKIQDNDLYENIFTNKPLSKIEYIQAIKDNNLINEDFNFSNLWGNLGPIYSKQLNLQITTLLKHLNSSSNEKNRTVVLYNFEDTHYVLKKPLYHSFQCYVTNNKLNLIWNQGSTNIISQLPSNILFYNLLLFLLCRETNLSPGKLVGSFNSVYLNNNEIKEATNNLNQELFSFSKIQLNDVNMEKGEFNYTLT